MGLETGSQEQTGLPLDTGFEHLQTVHDLQQQTLYPVLQVLAPIKSTTPSSIEFKKPKGHENPTKIPRYEINEQKHDGEVILRSANDQICFSTIKDARAFVKKQQGKGFKGILTISRWQKHKKEVGGKEIVDENIIEVPMIERYELQ